MKNLIIIAHPDMASSNANKAWREAAEKQADKFDIHEIYAAYPSGKIDVAREQELILNHDKIVLQFPLYWYSYPPLLKQWFDDVFAYGWAYGSTGGKLKDKRFALAITIGDEPKSYEKGGAVGLSMDEVIAPFKCAMNFTGAKLEAQHLGYGFSFHADAQYIAKSAEKYAEFLAKL